MWCLRPIKINCSTIFTIWVVYIINFSLSSQHTTAQGTPSSSQKELWKLDGQDPNHVHADDHLAVYCDPDIHPSSTTYLFSTLSQAWKYTKEKYGSFGNDTRLYLNLGSKKKEYCSIKTFRKENSSRNLIECGPIDSESNGWEHNSIKNFERLLSSLVEIIWRGAKGIFNDADLEISAGGMKDIVIYDIYLELKRPKELSYNDEIEFKDENLEQWKNDALNNSDRNIYWFRDWYLPIYERFGGNDVLERFYNYTYRYWKRRKRGDYAYMDNGTFIHYWSGAAGVDLLPLAKSVSGWTNLNQTELNQPRMYTTNFTYSEKLDKYNLHAKIPPGIWQIMNVNFSLIYYDKNVAFYSTDFKLYPLQSLKLISTAWKYINEKYFQSISLRRLFISLKNKSTERSGCSSEIDPSPNFQSNHVNVHFVHCYEDDTDIVPSEKIIPEIALNVLKLVSDTNENSWSAYNISSFSMTSIIVYDIYLSLGQIQAAHLWKSQKLDESDNFTVFWFRDWYLKIYELNAGENSTSTSPVLQNFFSLFREKWNRTGGKENKNFQMTNGEFLHFWSGAAERNLRNLNFTESLNRGKADQLDIKWLHARVKFPNFNYSVPEPTQAFPSTFYLQNSEPSDVTPPQLTNVYTNEPDTLGIYLDLTTRSQNKIQVQPTITYWLSNLYSKLWHYLRISYTDVLNKVNTNLYITFRKKKEKNCYLTLLRNMASEEGDKKLSNVIDCGYIHDFSNEWGANAKSVEPILYSLGELVKESLEFKNSDSATMSEAVKWMLKVVIFDLYLKEGRIEDAWNWLKNHKVQIPLRPKDWLLDWCLPIYYQYGGVYVLNKILSVSSEFLNVKQNITDKRQDVFKKNGGINMGEFIHFWSGAANESLKNLAVVVFGWNEDYQKKLKQARTSWPEITYECSDCVETASGINQGVPEGGLAIKIGVGSGATLFLIIIVFGIIFAIYQKKIKELTDIIRDLTPEEIEEFHRGNRTYAESDRANAPIHLLPFNSSFEVPQESLLVYKHKQLGCGEFGQVFLGSIQRETEGKFESVEVAVKTVKPNVDVNYFKAMLSEIKIMAFLGPHENIASLVATVTANIRTCEVFVAIEFCSNGDLLQYLRKNSTNYKDLWNCSVKSVINDVSACTYRKGKDKNLSVELGSYMTLETPGYSRKKPITLSTLNLLNWSIQISSGMAFLSSKNVVHGDLAARNVLLTSDNVAKISDFGLSRQILKYSNYTKKSSVPLPWRWMAIESLNEMIFSVHSDVWAFGITLWEIFTLGKIPYPGGNWNHDFTRNLERGDRLPPPDFGNSEVYDLMTMFCWKKDPKDRLGFPQIRTKLLNVMEGLESCARLHGDTPYSYFELE